MQYSSFCESAVGGHSATLVPQGFALGRECKRVLFAPFQLLIPLLLPSLRNVVVVKAGIQSSVNQTLCLAPNPDHLGNDALLEDFVEVLRGLYRDLPLLSRT